MSSKSLEWDSTKYHDNPFKFSIWILHETKKEIKQIKNAGPISNKNEKTVSVVQILHDTNITSVCKQFAHSQTETQLNDIAY